MAKEKRFYWIKLKQDFFNDDSMIWLERQQNGLTYVVLYLKLLLKTMNTNGQLAFKVGENLIPMSAEDISAITRVDVDTVIVAMTLLKQIGLVTESENINMIPDIQDMVGSETKWAKYKRDKDIKKLPEPDEIGNFPI